MPFLSLQSNISLDSSRRSELARALAELIAGQLKKPLEYVQIQLELDSFLTFAGTEEPTAFVELRSLGLPPDQPAPLTAAICRLLEEQTAIPAHRVFLNFHDMPRTHWGWNGTTFG